MKRRLLLVVLAALVRLRAGEEPVPNPYTLRERAILTLRKSEEDRERYSCAVESREQLLNNDGSVKSSHTRESDRFFVKGQEITHVFKKDGRTLTELEARKEQERVDTEVKKADDPKQIAKREKEGERAADMFLRAQKFSNGRREMQNGRGTIHYDLHGDPAFRASKLEERFAQAVSGQIWVDEQTGAPAELKLLLERDVKLGGGLLATVHKGFRFHLKQDRQPDGVWITTLQEGSGDARAALFFHPRFTFLEKTSRCHLFTVDSKATTPTP